MSDTEISEPKGRALLSRHCQDVNSTTIPRLLREHASLVPGTEMIDLGTAENWLMRDETVARMVQDDALAGVTAKSLSYPEGIGGPVSARAALARLLNGYFGPARPVNDSQIVLAAGASAALTVLVEQLCDPGDAILLEAPYWSGLDLCISERNDVRVVEVHAEKLHADQRHSQIAIAVNGQKRGQPDEDVQLPVQKKQILDGDQNKTVTKLIGMYESAVISAREGGVVVKALLLCNPSNPRGHCYTKDELAALLQFCAREKLHLISDEVFALSVHRPGSAFVSALALDAAQVEGSGAKSVDMTERLHVVYSLSKDFGCSGIRLGAVITQSSRPVLWACALALQNQVSVLTALVASGTLMEATSLPSFLTTATARLGESWAVVREFLEGNAITYLEPHAGVFVFARLCRDSASSWGDEAALQQCARQRQVNVTPGRNYHCSQPGWFRIAFAFPRDVIAEALHRLLQAIEDHESNRARALRQEQ